MDISGRTKVIGLFGDPVEHSLSPAMHNAAFKALNLPYIYVPFHVTPQNLQSAAMAIRALNIAGVNVTVPHKEAIIPYLDRLDESATLCQAVNTVVNRDGELTGYNTDGPGFIDSLCLDHNLNPRGIKSVILGAGGSARAIINQLIKEGASEIIIINRTTARAESLAKDYGNVRVFPLAGGYEHTLAGTQLVVNTLPVPFRQEGGGWIADLSRAGGALFYDLRYGGMQSDFREYAAELKSPSTDGLGMLLRQGARAFKLFCRVEVPVQEMKNALKLLT